MQDLIDDADESCLCWMVYVD